MNETKWFLCPPDSGGSRGLKFGCSPNNDESEGVWVRLHGLPVGFTVMVHSKSRFRQQEMLFSDEVTFLGKPEARRLWDALIQMGWTQHPYPAPVPTLERPIGYRSAMQYDNSVLPISTSQQNTPNTQIALDA